MMFEVVESLFLSKLFWFTVLPTVVCICYYKFVKFTYWKRKGLPYEEPVFIFGNIIRSCLGLISIGMLNII